MHVFVYMYLYIIDTHIFYFQYMCFIHFQLESFYVWLLHKYVLLYIHVHFILLLLFCYQKYLHEKLQNADCFRCLS